MKPHYTGWHMPDGSILWQVKGEEKEVLFAWDMPGDRHMGFGNTPKLAWFDLIRCIQVRIAAEKEQPKKSNFWKSLICR